METDPVPVVYCLLDPDSTVQYVRISQTYMIPLNEPGFRPSSEDLKIKERMLVYLAAERSDTRQDIFYGEPVENYPRDSGWFPADGGQVYRIRCSILPNCYYSLYIHLLESGRIIHARTRSFGTGFNIIDPEKVEGRTVNLYQNQDFIVRIKPVTWGSIYQTTLKFNYLELKDDKETPRSFVWPQPLLTQTDTSRSFIDQRISGERFMLEMSRALRPDPAIKRVPVGFDFHITVGGDDLRIKVNADNNAQSFSVIDVNDFDNAYGVFSCMSHRHVYDFKPSRFTIDTLALGPYTGNLGFLTNKQIDSLYHGHLD